MRLLLSILLLLPSVAFADSEALTDSLVPTTVQDGASPRTYWLVDTLNSSNDKRAGYNRTGQTWAGATGFGFDLQPVGTARIDSIVVMVEGYSSGTTSARRTYQIQLLKAGTGTGTVGTDILPGSLPENETRDWTHTGTGVNVLWGTTWSEADIENSGFGVQIRDNDATAHALYFDQIMIRVRWTDLGGLVTTKHGRTNAAWVHSRSGASPVHGR